jgi:esterase/lipase superfamily enzyme
MRLQCLQPVRRRPNAILALLILSTAVAGCGGKPQLMPTPNLYTQGGIDPFPDVPPALQNNKAEVLYVTDRALEKGSTPEGPNYGHKRSRSVAFGVAEVRFGKEDVTWDQLVKASTSAKREVKLEVAGTRAAEICRFPATPKTLIELPSAAEAATQPATMPSPLQEEVHGAMVRARQELSERLAKTPVKEVYVFVHGVKTGFWGSVTTAAELWHFLGRRGVAVAYSWPAGGEGLLRGYNYDYNSSEFTVYHLKETLRAIAGCPDVRKIHIVAHSRGTDVAVTALRELHLEISGSGRVTRDVMKLGTVVLAAADLDVDVVMQRAATARLGKVPERSVIYISSSDQALGFSRWLFGGTRLGKLKPDIFTKEELAALRTSPYLAIVDARVTKPGSFGHNYFYSNPAVSSDLILVLRYGKSPGAGQGRPLKIEDSGFWQIVDGYPGRVSAAQLRDAPAAAAVSQSGD